MSNGIIGVILAGGLARRLGRVDKAFVRLGQTNLLQRAIDICEPQCSQIIINANGDPDRFHQTTKTIVADTIQGHAGPLAGVLAAMQWVLRNSPQTKWIATLPVDTPFAPDDFALKLLSQITKSNSEMACASSNGRHHPVVGLWPVNLADDLRDAMINEDIRKVDQWTARYKLINVEFEVENYDPFFNINTPQDIETGEKTLLEISDAS